jgi:hypothetical protein
MYSTMCRAKAIDHLEALPPPMPKDEFTLGRAAGQEANIFAECTGLYGFIAKSVGQALFPDTNSKGRNVYFQRSRQISNVSRRYYEHELGAVAGPSMSGTDPFGYTEPLRRFIQRESFEPQANELPNRAPSWLPGNDYYTDFHKGDPYIKVDQEFARLPGAGYEAVHPEIAGIDPESYSDITKLAILADVAPYPRK